jgi:hypothetical protein
LPPDFPSQPQNVYTFGGRIARYADQVDSFVAEANVAEAAAYMTDLGKKRGLSTEVCAEALLSLLLSMRSGGRTPRRRTPSLKAHR